MKRLAGFGVVVCLSASFAGCAMTASTPAALTLSNAQQALSGNWYGVHQGADVRYCWLNKMTADGKYTIEFKNIAKDGVSGYVETGTWVATPGLFSMIAETMDSKPSSAHSDYVIKSLMGEKLEYESTTDKETYVAMRKPGRFVMPVDCSYESR